MTATDTKPEPTTCHLCGATIYFVVTSKATSSGKWVTNPNQPTTWHCNAKGPDFPVLTHSPAQRVVENA